MNLAEQLRSTIATEVPFRGMTIKVRLAPIDLWVKEGKVPNRFQELFLKMNGGASNFRQVSEEEAEKIGREEIEFKEAVVRYCLVDPPITPSEAEKNENALTIEEVQQVPGLYEFVYGWGVYRGAQSFINTKGGEIKTDDLDKFRGEQSKPDSVGSDSGTIQPEAVSATGNSG